jgi:type VI secretion system protein ImpK
MTKDSNDDPFATRGATIFRPRPGAGKRGSDATNPGERIPAHAPPPGSPPAPPPAPSPGRGPAAGAVRDFSAPGLNPLLQAASPLLILMGRLRTNLIPNDIGMLRRQTLEQIREFEERGRASGVAPETVLAARYVHCSAVDE